MSWNTNLYAKIKKVHEAQKKVDAVAADHKVHTSRSFLNTISTQERAGGALHHETSARMCHAHEEVASLCFWREWAAVAKAAAAHFVPNSSDDGLPLHVVWNKQTDSKPPITYDLPF
jgi:hypothetical protein